MSDISIFEIFKNPISENDRIFLRRIGLHNESEVVMKTCLLFLRNKHIIEQSIFDVKGLEYILSKSNDIDLTLRYLLKIEDEPVIPNPEIFKVQPISTTNPPNPTNIPLTHTIVEQKEEKTVAEKILPANYPVPHAVKIVEKDKIKKITTFEKKRISEFICEMYNSDGCNPLASKISNALVRVAATRIFADPEQSIMELPVNSVDSYNQLAGNKTVGKFGMGFFSILYWILQPASDGTFKRDITIKTTYLLDKILKGTILKIEWSSEGLIVRMNQCPPDKRTGTGIRLDCSKQPLDSNSLYKLFEQLQKLDNIEGARVIINGSQINRDVGQNIVNVVLNTNEVMVADFAAGINENVIIESLLVPSSSSKTRSFDEEPYRHPICFQQETPIYRAGFNYLNLIVNGVRISTIRSETKEVPKIFNIYMPYNSKVPVSRDDIIYEHGSKEVVFFKRSILDLISLLRKYDGDIVPLLELLSEYCKKNRSDALLSCVLEIRKEIEESSLIKLPCNSLWKSLRPTQTFKNESILYDTPDMFDTERKIDPYLSQFAIENVFKMRKIVRTPLTDKLVTSGGMFTYLFVGSDIKTQEDLANLSLSNSETLLIPFSEDFDVDIVPDLTDKKWVSSYLKAKKLSFKISNELERYFKILKCTWLRKFASFDRNEVYIYEFLYGFNDAIKDDAAMISFITSLNAKYSDMKIRPIYGRNAGIYPYEFGDVFQFSKSLDVKLKDKRGRVQGEMYTLEREYNQFIINLIKEMMKLFVEITPNDTDGSASFPDILDFDFTRYSIYHDRITREIMNGIQKCTTKHEKFLFMHIFLPFIDKYYYDKRSFEGIGSYFVDELRRKFSSPELFNFIYDFYYSVNHRVDTVNRLITPLTISLENYFRYTNTKLTEVSYEINQGYRFSAKSLIKYIFTNTTLNVPDISEQYKTFTDDETKVQIVEIAVNEGTTKPFIQSVLTELIQNSIDAIRGSGAQNRNVDISISESIISVKDYVGFSNIETIMIPFYSSKDPNDPNVTGEMGTGFFNVYRQPWTKFVIIRTVVDGTCYFVKATPLVRDNIVYDIEYNMQVSKITEENSTVISIVLKKNIELLARTITDAFIFTGSYLSIIRCANLRLNEKPITSNYQNCYSDEYVDVYTINDRNVVSFVLTNDIPFCNLEVFIKDFQSSDDEMVKLVSSFCLNSIVVNVKKGAYVPSQARTKINIPHTLLTTFGACLKHGIYNAILSLYVQNLYPRDNYVIELSDSESSISQLKISKYSKSNILKYPFGTLNGIGNNIREIINGLINKILKDEMTIDQIDQSSLLGKAVYKWFSNKKLKEEKNKSVYKGPEPRESSILQRFVDIYWRYVNRQIDIGRIKIDRRPNPLAPKVFMVPLGTVRGCYIRDNHTLCFGIGHYDDEEFRRELMKFKTKGIINNVAAFSVNNVISKFLSPSIPAVTLLHELGHAIQGQSHNESSHGTTSIKIDTSDYLEFDEMCIEIYKLCVQDGVIMEFITSL